MGTGILESLGLQTNGRWDISFEFSQNAGSWDQREFQGAPLLPSENLTYSVGDRATFLVYVWVSLWCVL